MTKRNTSKAARQAALAQAVEAKAQVNDDLALDQASEDNAERAAEVRNGEAEETSAYGTIAEAAMVTVDTRAKTVVGTGYKNAYRARAKAQGRKDKASARGCGDWLQRELQAETIVKGEFDFDRFVAILDANGVDYSRWNTTSHGWKGRFRMSGSIVLRGVVGKSGLFRTPDGEVNVAELAESDELAAAFVSKWAN